ncbi:hypothetical protein KY289_031535 [Solanum tuberosum]|nr:hypothetical protein KY289_031535 [Solanum tuberosum]
MSFPQCWNKTAGGVMEGEFQEKKKRKRRNRRRPQPPVWKVMHGQATKDETRMVKTKIPLVEETKNEDVSKEPELVASFGCLIRSNIPVLNSFQSLTMEASTSTGDPMGLHLP